MSRFGVNIAVHMEGRYWKDHIKTEGVYYYSIWKVDGRTTDVSASDKFHWHVSAAELHDGVTKWKHFPRDWPFVRGIHRSPMNKGQWRGVLMFSLIYFWTNGWVNNQDADEMRRHRTHYDVTVIKMVIVASHQDEWFQVICRASTYYCHRHRRQATGLDA